MIFARALKRIAGGYAQVGTAERIAGHAGIGRSVLADQAYAGQASDVYVGVTKLTAARTLTLPAAAAYPSGQPLDVVDESGACSSTLVVSIAPAGSDTVNGGAAALALAAPFACAKLFSDGVSNWTSGVLGVAGGGTGASQAGGGALDNVLGIAGQAGGGLLTRTAAGVYSFMQTTAFARSGANSDITGLSALTSLVCKGAGLFWTLTGGGQNANFGTSPPSIANTGRFIVGWNMSGGNGETAFLANRGPGSTGGFRFYDQDNSGNNALIGTLTAQYGATFSALSLAVPLAVGSGGTGTTTSTGSGSLVMSASPALTGTPTAPTQPAGDNAANLATTGYVDRAVAAGGGLTRGQIVALAYGDPCNSF